ncbi:MAG: hypothetical protein K2X11_21900 [Acetobacteraceae bacterium]|nr:hypothetical protein [Acetobacteraceae bacterium]
MTERVLTPRNRRPSARDEAPMSLPAYMLHGSAWIAFLLFLFWLAGLKF